jgi:hypothetical protein
MSERRETWITTGGDKVTVYEGFEGESRWNERHHPRVEQP